MGFCDIYSFKHLVKEPTCYKNIENPKCIDLKLTSRQRNFQNSCVIQTALSDFHKMTETVLKSYFHKQESKIIYYKKLLKTFAMIALGPIYKQRVIKETN